MAQASEFMGPVLGEVLAEHGAVVIPSAESIDRLLRAQMRSSGIP